MVVRIVVFGVRYVDRQTTEGQKNEAVEHIGNGPESILIPIG